MMFVWDQMPRQAVFLILFSILWNFFDSIQSRKCNLEVHQFRVCNLLQTSKALIHRKRAHDFSYHWLVFLCVGSSFAQFLFFSVLAFFFAVPLIKFFYHMLPFEIQDFLFLISPQRNCKLFSGLQITVDRFLPVDWLLERVFVLEFHRVGRLINLSSFSLGRKTGNKVLHLIQFNLLLTKSE